MANKRFWIFVAIVVVLSVVAVYLILPFFPKDFINKFEGFKIALLFITAFFALWLTLLQVKQIIDEAPNLAIRNIRAFLCLDILPLGEMNKRSKRVLQNKLRKDKIGFYFLNYVVLNKSAKPNSIIKIAYTCKGKNIARATDYILGSPRNTDGDKFKFKPDINGRVFTVDDFEIPRPNIFVDVGQAVVISDVISVQDLDIQKENIIITITDAYNNKHNSISILKDIQKSDRHFFEDYK